MRRDIVPKLACSGALRDNFRDELLELHESACEVVAATHERHEPRAMVCMREARISLEDRFEPHGRLRPPRCGQLRPVEPRVSWFALPSRMSASDDGLASLNTELSTLSETELGPPTLSTTLPSSAESTPTPGGGSRYLLGPLIGSGGMGDVRIARDTRMGRDVAVKVLRADGRRDDLRTRFLREARIQGRLEHPAIVPVHDLGVDDAGSPFFVMKRLTGLTLAAILARAPQELQLAKQWTRRALLDRLVDICQAIEYAHQRGVIHRDLKPQNIMLGDLGEVYVLDWGIARILDEVHQPPAHTGDVDTLDLVGKTQTGALVGTPGYMAPEQYRGDVIDQRTDVYALGCILFEILTGESALPRDARAFEATLNATAHSPSARAPAAEIPPELDALCAAATHPLPASRIATARALADGIQRYLDGDRDVARRRELANGYATDAASQLDTATTEEQRARAMHDAGRALALDPTHRAAQGIVGRLLLEPPEEIPAAVERTLEKHRDNTGRSHMRTAALTYVSYFAFLPFLAFTRVYNPFPMIVIFAAIIANLTILLSISRRPNPSQLWMYVVLVIHGALLATCGILVSTPLILPAMAVTSLGAFLSNPRVRSAPAVFAVHVAAVFAPLALELLDVIPRTFALDGNTIAISPWSVSLSSKALLVIVMLAALSHLIATTLLVRQLRRAEETAQEEVHLYKWHLERLVPSWRSSMGRRSGAARRLLA